MSVDRDPRVGDVFRWAACGGGWLDQRRVVAVTERFVHWEFVRNAEGGALPAHLWRERATLVPARPRIADHWGVVAHHVFYRFPSESHARRSLYPGTLCVLARIVGGVVCDEHGEPLEPA